MIENILLILLILLLSAKLFGALFEKIGFDSSIGELLTGIIFGVSILNLIEAKSVEYFAIIGSVLILFVVGLKQRDIEDIYHDKKSIYLGLMMLFITSIVMTLFFYFIPRYFDINFSVIQSIVMGFAFAIIDVGVPAKILISKGLISLPVGKIVIRSAIIDIIAGLLMFTIASTIFNLNMSNVIIKLGGILLLAFLIVLLFYFFSNMLLKHISMKLNSRLL